MWKEQLVSESCRPCHLEGEEKMGSMVLSSEQRLTLETSQKDRLSLQLGSSSQQPVWEGQPSAVTHLGVMMGKRYRAWAYVHTKENGNLKGGWKNPLISGVTCD